LADFPIDAFELIGDPDTLPEAFFDSLAALLLSIEECQEIESSAANICKPVAAEGSLFQLDPLR
jgi:hypothetical protein